MRFLISLILLCVPAWAQRELSGAARVHLALKRLANTGSALMIAAHPDDENNALLAWLARGRCVRTAYLSLTRGEGGQNLIGPEQGSELGVIRTQELLAARRIDGAEQLFTSAVDFGFSKTAQETIRIWGRERMLGELEAILNAFQPDIVILRFSGTPADGHGHHQASAILAREAIARLAERGGWKVRRVFHNVFGSPAGRQVVTMDTGEYDPVLGASYAEIGGMSRSVHRTQGFGAPERKGPVPVYLALLAGEPAAKDPFEGIDTTWKRYEGGASVATLLDRARAAFRPERPHDIIPLLAEARAVARQIKDPAAQRKLIEFDETIALCAGLWLDASANHWLGSENRKIRITLTALNRSPAEVTLLAAGLYGVPEGTRTGVKLEANRPFTQAIEAPVKRGLEAFFRLKVGDADLEIRRPVIYRWVDPARGELTRDFVVAPPAALSLPETPLLFPEAKPRKVAVRVSALTESAEGSLSVRVPQGWSAEPAMQPFFLKTPGDTAELEFVIYPPKQEAVSTLTAVARLKTGEQVRSGLKVIDYPHIRPQVLLPPAEMKLVRTPVATLARRVGYVMGAGDELPPALEQLGCRVTLLTDQELMTGDLSVYDAIVTGVRAYDVRAVLRISRQRLLNYISQGGTLVVQYNKLESERGKTSEFSWGPYPFKINRGRVTEEDAALEFLHPEDPLMKWPNAITPRDAEGWIQERGLYFASEWDARYRTLFSTHDAGEAPLQGGLLYAPVGKGAFVFTAFSWFRQLPAGTPGAYRIFANILSAGKVLHGQSPVR